MTRSLADVTTVLELARSGLSKRAISVRTGVARATIRDWLSDPAHALERGRRGSGPNGQLKSCESACKPWAGIREASYAYLLGMYLGDGCISKHSRAYRLRIACCDTYPGIMRDVETAISRLLPVKVGRVHQIGCTEVSAYSQHWPCFFPQHGSGPKHERDIRLATWQQEIVARLPRPFLRGLIHSDGWRGDNVAIRTTDLAIEYRTYTRYQFSNRSDDIRRLFCDACDLLGVHWTQSNQWTISIARRKDVHYLDSFIGPKR
jgi:hypothetical protein